MTLRKLSVCLQNGVNNSAKKKIISTGEGLDHV